MTVNLDEMGPGELEKVLDEVHSRLARRYGKDKAEIAKLAAKRYGGSETMSDTDDLLRKLDNIRNNGRQDVTDKMLTMEMIRDLRAERERQERQPPPPQYYPQPQPQMQQPEKMNLQDMMVYPMMFMMFKAMMGGDDDMMKFQRMRMIYGDGDSKNMDLEKMERLMAEERAYNEQKFEKFMNTIVGKQEAEKLQEREEKWKKEMEQRTQQAYQMARNPPQPQDPYISAKQRMDEATDMMVDTKRKMEEMGMVQRPESVEDKEFTKGMTQLKHQQGIETQAVSKGLEHVGKGVDNLHKLAERGIDMMAKEQEVRQRQFDMASPEERKRLQKQYAELGAQVMQEQQYQEPEEDYGGMEPEEGEVEDFTDVDDEQDIED